MEKHDACNTYYRWQQAVAHFGDILVLDQLGDQADFSLSHGAVELAAEQALVDIGTFEAESGSRPARARGCATPA